MEPAGHYQITIARRDAFSKSFESVEITGARAVYIPGGTSQRRTAGSVRLVLVTPQGQHEVVRDVVGNTQAISSTLAPMKDWANTINTALSTRQPAFTLDIPPESTFWFMLALAVLFASAGLFIAVSGNRPTPG